jgi:hypothetical protein
VQVWQGAIAGSAPIWTFEGETPPVDPLFYAKTVTYDTTPAAGAAGGCTAALRAAFHVLTASIERREHAGDSLLSAEGGLKLNKVSSALNICPRVKLNSTDDLYTVRDWASSAFDMMAMGNYPYASSYMLNGHGILPPFPMRVACDNALGVLAAHAEGSAAQLTQVSDSGDGAATDVTVDAHGPEALLVGLAAAVEVWFNYSGAMCAKQGNVHPAYMHSTPSCRCSAAVAGLRNFRGQPLRALEHARNACAHMGCAVQARSSATTRGRASTRRPPRCAR